MKAEAALPSRNTYFIQCHESAERLKLLFRTIYNPESSFILHCDKKSPWSLVATASALVRAFPNVYLLPSRWVSWGGYSQVDILVDAVRHAASDEKPWNHFILLSEHHVPVRPAASFSDFLADGISYFSSTHYRDMGVGQSDIDHRFSADWRELPAWGMFPFSRVDRLQWVESCVYHGSNWVVLSREHCLELVRAIDEDGPIIQNLKNSVQPDEMFVQTVLGNRKMASGSHQNTDTTYVAWPHLSGTNDLTFIGANYFDAREKGCLFIRKSPQVIPPAVTRSIEEFAVFSSRELDELLQIDSAPSIAVRARENLAPELRTEINALGLTAVDVAKSAVHFCPAFYMKVKDVKLRDDLFVGLLSEDMEHFKVLVCWRHHEVDLLKPLPVKGFETHTLKARVADLVFNREVVNPHDARRGFFCFSEFDSAIRMANYVKTYFDFAMEFAEVLK